MVEFGIFYGFEFSYIFNANNFRLILWINCKAKISPVIPKTNENNFRVRSGFLSCLGTRIASLFITNRVDKMSTVCIVALSIFHLYGYFAVNTTTPICPPPLGKRLDKQSSITRKLNWLKYLKPVSENDPFRGFYTMIWAGTSHMHLVFIGQLARGGPTKNDRGWSPNVNWGWKIRVAGKHHHWNTTPNQSQCSSDFPPCSLLLIVMPIWIFNYYFRSTTFHINNPLSCSATTNRY